MANSFSTQDLVKGVLQRSGEVFDGSSPFHSLALKYLNNVYTALLSGSNEFAPDVGDAWVWARSTKSFVINPWASGVAAVTNGSNQITLSVASATSLVDSWIKFTNLPTYYLVTSHTAGSTAVTLNQIYIEPTAATIAYTAYPLIYDLGALTTTGIMRLVEPLRIYSERSLDLGEDRLKQGQIDGIDIDSFRSRWPLEYLQLDVPSKFTTISRSDSSWKIQFNKSPNTSIKVDFDYIATQADLLDESTSVPLIPREFRRILESGAAFYLLEDKENSAKADRQFKLTTQGIMSMWKAEQKNKKLTTTSYGRINARQEDRRYLHGV